MIKINFFKKIIFILNQCRYRHIVRILKNRTKNGEKIRVCFFVMFASTFNARVLYKKMLQSKLFQPFIVVIPDTSRGIIHQRHHFKKTYESLKNKYKHVYNGWDDKTNTFFDYSIKSDIIVLANLYNKMSHDYFELGFLLKKPILTMYLGYSFMVTNFSIENFKSNNCSYLWKFFLPTDDHYKQLKLHQIIKGKNALVTGYSKMDDLEKKKPLLRKRKLIIISPHHTVSDWKLLQISNFLKYADFFLTLPKIYPKIDFVFRPHPLLWTQLKKENIWGTERINNYLNSIISNPNSFYSDEPDYLDLFINSDGIIHDCASFLAEYLFTYKPVCYLLKNKETIKKYFMPIESDIINFINKVILEERDYMVDRRKLFVEETLKINYPHSTSAIMNHLNSEFLSK